MSVKMSATPKMISSINTIHKSNFHWYENDDSNKVYSAYSSDLPLCNYKLQKNKNKENLNIWNNNVIDYSTLTKTNVKYK